MKGLLIKDAYLLAQRRQSWFIILAGCLLMGISTDGSFIIGYMTMLGVIIAMSTVSYDEADGGMPFLMTLPAERRTYVLSKYAGGALLCFAAWVLGVVVMLAVNAVRGGSADMAENLGAALVFPFVAVFMLDVMIPVQLKYGPEKSRTVILVVFGAIAAVIALAAKLGGSGAAAGAAMMLDSVPNGVYIAVSLIICAVLTIVSVSISRRIMDAKEF